MATDNEQDSAPQSTSGGSPSTTNSFNKGMLKDYNETFVGEGLYTHARNAVNSSHDGQVGVIGNEPSNLHCVDLPYTMIGCIHLTDDRWVIFTTDDTNSEIGIFDESDCTYEPLKSPDGNKIDFTCLNLKKTNLITGVSRKRFDCDRMIYFDDGLNPTRVLNVDKVPVVKSCVTTAGCTICTEIVVGGFTTLDCEEIRIAPYISHPCIKIKKGEVSGTLPNGSYQACIGYLIDGVRIGDYLGLTDVQSVFTHDNVGSSLQIDITNIDTDYNEFELVILSNINAQGTAKIIGRYSTSQGTIYLDRWSNAEYTPIPVSDIIFRSEPVEKTDTMYSVNNYLLRIGVYSKYKFNYQPLANQIRTKWAVVEYPEDYYIKGGNRVGYMRDEQYSFFIRFVYNTGEFSESYHIPGRPITTGVDDVPVVGGDAFASEGSMPTWKIYNTATVTSTTSSQPSYLDGGKILASGDMGYWESTEKYPGDKPEIWNSFPNLSASPFNLCGKNIRHHKMPDETKHPLLSTFQNGGDKIRLLGVQFENIKFPLDENGNPITSIVGYEILRGSREGNKSILAKGLINNMREYPVPENPGITGLYPNYPYNDLTSDKYLTAVEQNGNNGTNNDAPLTGYRRNIFTFHSPDTTFTNPYLNPYSLNLYQQRSGSSTGYFQTPYKHPQFKLAGDLITFFDTIMKAVTLIDTVSSIYKSGSVSIAATEDFPVAVNYEVPPFPPFPSPAGGDATGAIATAAAFTAFAAQVALWAATVAAVVGLSKALLQLKREKIYNMLFALIPKRQYAAQYNSYGFYNNGSVIPAQGNRRREIKESSYVSNYLQQFTSQYQINNLYRSRTVALSVGVDIADPSVQDNSRFLISDVQCPAHRKNTPCSSTISSYYGGLKFSIPSQYGQLDSIKQLPIVTYDELGNCKPSISANGVYKTGVLFGGDIYINRYTEKNTMFFFNTWLKDEEEPLYVFDYTSYPNLPYPKYWINNVQNHTFFSSFYDYRNLDYYRSNFSFFVTRGYFYLFNSGVRDFFVESEVNVAYRDWEEDIPKRHYDPYRFTDLNLMFRSDLIENSANYYKYDYSLSVSKLVNSYVTWGSMLPREYDPTVYSTCYKYKPNKVIYSLPQSDESKKDNWRLYLPNNYKEFSSPVSSIKSVNKTGALFMMKRQSPLQFLGVEELQLEQSGTKVTIGDGGLFTGAQQLQAVVNADSSYEYGSNQGRFCAINTLYGLFWVSQNQGKVFQYDNSLNDITNGGLKWWFAKYLPSELLKRFPDYPLYDNPVVGVGCQMIYDNTYELIYITKRDWKPVDPSLKYNSTTNSFYIPGTSSVTYTCPDGYTLNGNVCTKDCCPEGYTLTNGECVKILTADPIPVGSVVNLTPTPYIEYGKGTTVPGTSSVLVYPDSVYHNNLASALAAGAVQLDPGNSFWGFDSGASDTQAGQLNNGPVNRLSKWGLVNDPSGNPYNNYNTPGGAGNLLPINVWTGFTTCLTIEDETTYHVCVAADNRFRILVDGTVILGSPSTTTFNFNFLHIYPITIAAGSHTLVVEGINEGAKACFAVEIFDLNNLPGGQTPVQYLNAQTSYTNLDARTIFSTRTATQFTSGAYICPPGYTASSSGNCTIPTCTLTEIIPVEQCTIPAEEIVVENNIPCPFEDERCFEPASWTVSYDPKIKAWISFHDWIPTFVIPGKNHFMTVDYDSIWKHNIRCDSYCNYYGIDYPFEIEFVSSTGQEVVSMRNIEYILEVYNYSNDCRDKFHVLDQNFDQAIVYNSEQISGVLELNLKTKNDPLALLNYPQINLNSISIQFSKEENKYRFNQFWDITNNRGEYVPNTIPMFNVEPNGYKYNVNPAYVDYNKSPLERKKFRHYTNKVFLRKYISDNNKLLFKFSNQKLLPSAR